MQNPFLDTIVPVIYDVTDAIAIPTLFVILFLASWILKKEKLKKILFCVFSKDLTLKNHNCFCLNKLSTKIAPQDLT